MKTRILTLTTLLLATVAFLLPAPRAQAKAADVKINLAAPSNATPGKATAKFRNRGGEQELQVEVETARRLAGTTFLVAVGDTLVGRLTIDAFGKGRLSLVARRGAGLPEIKAGTVVSVLTLTGTPVFTGTF